MRVYLRFIAEHPRFLSFGLLAAFFSSFGQTFFVALFGGEWREDFALSHGEFGGLYSAATLLSGLTIIGLGRGIDRVDLRRYTAWVCGGLTAACLLTAAVPSIWLLGVAFYGLRLSGQGLMSHVSTVAMARYFDIGRGKALSIASLGHPAGEAVLPLAAVALTDVLGWRIAWAIFGGLLLLGLIPLMLWLLRGHGEREAARMAREAGADPAVAAGSRSLGQVLRDPVFYPLVVAMLAPAFIVTGLFFHQVHLAETKGWALEWLASSFIAFAAGQVLSSLVAGSLADRFDAVRMLPAYLPMLGLATLTLAFFDHPAAAPVYLALAGLSAGSSATLLGAVWAELYGTAHLGAIRSLVQATMVFSTAASPVLFGTLLDRGVSFETLALACAGYVAGAIVVLTALQPALRARAGDRPPAG